MHEDVMSPPEIDYLAKDYASFRQLMLDHLALRVPEWTERSEADLGIALVEVLAYVADYLSYYQDAVATEAYPGTARRRSSVKRHVRLLDYVLHEGCNARVWVQVQVKEPLILPQATQLLTDTSRATEQPVVIPPHSNAYDEALSKQVKVFETMYNLRLFPQHNEIRLYAEEGEEVSLPAGSTSALLCDPGTEHKPGLRLKTGDVLVFEEVKNTTTGTTTGADQTRRYAVRLTGCRRHSRGVLQVMWHEEDAFPSPLRLAVLQQGDLISDISVVRGNIVLADHGQTIDRETLPSPKTRQRYRPYLGNSGPASAVPYHHEQAVKQSAHRATRQDVRAALPLLALFQQGSSLPLNVDVASEFSPDMLTLSDHLRQQLRKEGIVLSQQVSLRAVHGIGWELHDTIRGQYWLVGPGERHLSFNTFNKWRVRRDLLSSDAFARDFTVDLDEDRRASLRFGFGASGKQPEAGDCFQVTYRVGGGEVGNVHAETIIRIVSMENAITSVRNPLAAAGGTDPEELEKVRNLAPYAFRAPACCVTEEDYATIARQYPRIANVVTRLNWQGDMPVVTLYVQREEGQPVDRVFMDKFSAFLETYRLAGQAFAVSGPYFVGLRVALTIWLQRSTIRSTIEKTLQHLLSNAPGGFFALATFTFGQPVYQSRLLAILMTVPGVERVEIETFCRFDTTPATCEEVIVPGPLEIVRLDNDEAVPANGRLSMRLEGGL